MRRVTGTDVPVFARSAVSNFHDPLPVEVTSDGSQLRHDRRGVARGTLTGGCRGRRTAANRSSALRLVGLRRGPARRVRAPQEGLQGRIGSSQPDLLHSSGRATPHRRGG